MATRKCWSRTVGARRGNRVRIYEREPGGILYVAVWNGERGTYAQRSLGHKDRDRATREAAELVRLRDAGEWNDSRSFTLGMLVARYTAFAGLEIRDGPAPFPDLRERPENRPQIHRFAPERQNLGRRVVTPMSVLRELAQKPWRRADDLIDEGGRVRGSGPVLQPLVVMLEVIAELAIRKWIVLVDCEQCAQRSTPLTGPPSRWPKNL